MDPYQINPVVAVASAFGVYLIWMTVDKVFNKRSQTVKSLSQWMKKRKIIEWKNEKEETEFYNDQLENRSLKFFGCSQSGEALFVELSISQDRSRANFILVLKDGSTFTIPETELVVTSQTITPRICSTRGLTIEPNSPFSKWRITYNGLCYIKQFGVEEEKKDLEPQHVTFSFFWTAASDPLDWPENWSANLLAGSLGDRQQLDSVLDELLATDGGFDQFGLLFGQVTIESGESKDIFEMNLPGVRTSRNFIATSTRPFLETYSLMAACKDGQIVSISAREIGNQKTGEEYCQFFDNDWLIGSISRIYSGSVRMPNVEVHSIDDVDLDMDDILSGNSSTDISFNIRASNKDFKSTIRIAPNSHHTIRNDGHEIRQTRFTIDVNGQPGNGFLITSNIILDNDVDAWPLGLKKSIHDNYDPENASESNNLAMFFNEPDAQSEHLCGGKGSSLAFLTQLVNKKYPFVVPQGFSLTTDAFDLQLKDNRRIKDAISNIENIAYKRANGTLEQACGEVLNLFTSTPIAEEVAAEIKKAFSILENNSGTSLKVAVRSSAIGEDGTESSSAGQNETFLGVQTMDQVLVAIQKCWASLFTVQSVTYRIQSIQPIDTKMSVVVQTMVAPDCAGVLFTQHPVTNDPRKFLITANYGLGESVVSGAVDSDMFTIQRLYKTGRWNILEKKLGSKDTFVHMTSEANVKSSQVKESLRKALCLSDEDLLKLCKIGSHLQESYGSPRDIEWAICKGEVYLLQSRAMTSISSYTTWEITHELDSAVMSDEEYFTFGNFGEVLPEVVSPLAISILLPALERGLLMNVPIFEMTRYANSMITISHYRAIINVLPVFLRSAKKEITIQNRMRSLVVLGHEFLTDEICRIAVHRYGVASKSFEFWSLWLVIKCGWKGKSAVEEMARFIQKFKSSFSANPSQMEQKSSEEMCRMLSSKVGDDFTYVQTVHALTSAVSTMIQMILFSILHEGSNTITSEFLNDITTLLSSCQNAESAEIPILIEEMASNLLNYDNVKAQEFCDITPDEGIDWLAVNCSTSHSLFVSFIEKHAHRGYNEFELASTTWCMDPEFVIEMLQNTIRHWILDESVKEYTPKRTNEEILADLKTPTKSFTRRAVKFLLPYCQAYVELRERSKSYSIAYIHELRKIYLCLAQKLLQDGLLPDTNLIFYLTHQEIGTLIDERHRIDLIGRAIRRRRLSPELRKLCFDELNSGIVRPKGDNQMAMSNDSVKVIGMPVCKGKLSGRACVVKSFAEVTKIKAGDIIITHSTDVAWSPYFPILSGVVSELGGLISHGAVVAREYGLPCIVGATNATTLIADGDEIYMDASAGIITKIEKNISQVET